MFFNRSTFSRVKILILNKHCNVFHICKYKEAKMCYTFVNVNFMRINFIFMSYALKTNDPLVHSK